MVQAIMIYQWECSNTKCAVMTAGPKPRSSPVPNGVIESTPFGFALTPFRFWRRPGVEGEPKLPNSSDSRQDAPPPWEEPVEDNSPFYCAAVQPAAPAP